MNPDKLIHSRKWKWKRQNILQRDGYIDQYLLKKDGRTVEATVVHHILPKEKFPQYSMADWNLISVARDTHMGILHNPISGELTREGRQLMIETAYKNNIAMHERVLVIGMPGVGKTRYVREHMGRDAIVYDLDAIAGALRLSGPNGEPHDGARRMTNALFKAFALRALEYAPRVFLIRTSSSVREVSDIQPDRIVLIEGEPSQKRIREMKDFNPEIVERRIREVLEFADQNNIHVEKVSPPSTP